MSDRSAGGAASNSVSRLVGALLWRSAREQGIRLVLLPLGFAVFLLVITLTAFYVPNLLTGPTRSALERGAAVWFGDVEGRAGLALAVLLQQGPYLLGLFASFLGASNAQALLGAEVSRGGVEGILSLPYRVRDLFAALLVTAFALTALQWAVLAVATLGLAAVTLAMLGASFELPAGYVTLALGVPLALALWANMLGMILSVLAPGISQVRTGATNLVQTIAMLPAVIMVIVVSVRPELNLTWLAGGALAVGMMGTAVSAGVLARFFRPETLLSS